jgi:hypothetical protein
MLMTCRTAAFAVLSLVLAGTLVGCAGGETNWTKQGVARNVVSDDYEDCRQEARASSQRDAGIDADILASRSTDWSRAGTLPLQQDQMAASTKSQGQRVIAACMFAKGYKPAQ